MKESIYLKPLEFKITFPIVTLQIMIDHCPDELWNDKKYGFAIREHLQQAISGGFFHLKDENKIIFEEPYEKEVSLEIYFDPKENISKDEIKKHFIELREMILREWFKDRDDNWLIEKSKINSKITNYDTLLSTIEVFNFQLGNIFAILNINNAIFNENN